jgi:hypothetical protein
MESETGGVIKADQSISLLSIDDCNISSCYCSSTDEGKGGFLYLSLSSSPSSISLTSLSFFGATGKAKYGTCIYLLCPSLPSFLLSSFFSLSFLNNRYRKGNDGRR